MSGLFQGQPQGDVPGLDPSEQKSWQIYLMTVLRITTLLDRQLTDRHKLSLLDVGLLALLGESFTGTVQMGDLADALPLLPNRLTRQISRLEERDLVRRSTDPADRRRVMLTITPDGRTALKQAMVTYADSIRSYVIDPLSRIQVAGIDKTCKQISDILERS